MELNFWNDGRGLFVAYILFKGNKGKMRTFHAGYSEFAWNL
jgi:hypothetical protein